MPTQRRLATLALLTTSLIWGAALPIVKPVFDTLSVIQFLFARYLVAALFAFPLIFFLKKPRLPYSVWIKIIALEFLGTSLLLPILYEGVKHTSALESSLIGSMSPLFTIIGGIWFLREKETNREWQGFAVALLGTLILVFEPLFIGNGSSSGSLYGNLLVLANTLIWTVYLLYAKKLYRKMPKLLIAAMGNVIGFVSFGLYSFFTQSLPSITLLTSGYTPIPILYMGLLGSLLAVALYLYGQNKIEISEASVYTYLQPLVAIPVAYLLLHETPTWFTLIAIVLIGIGVYRAELKSS